MSDITDLVPALKRAAAPGGFDALYPELAEADLKGRLLDAVAEAQLDGFLSDYEYDVNTGEIAPNLSQGTGEDIALNSAGALVILYAGYTLVLAEIRNIRNRTNYVAGAVQAEEERTASMLNEILRQLADRKRKLIERAELADMATDVFVGDLNFIKATEDWRISPQLEAYQFRGV